mmetsp:Transcript_21004/g.66542  ORF Transcript_21004/g.66542 Transcript_21004/m.66542 type:complete len:353 (+) Transcript_21004:1164-2222(+)
MARHNKGRRLVTNATMESLGKTYCPPPPSKAEVEEWERAKRLQIKRIVDGAPPYCKLKGFNSGVFEYQIHTAFPRRQDMSSKAYALDGTPNYFAFVLAAEQIYAAAQDPRLVKFILFLRHPVKRVYSHFRMFRKLRWERRGGIVGLTSKQFDGIEDCWRDASEDWSMAPGELKDFMKLKDEDFLRLYMRCFFDRGFQYASLSLYAVHLRRWMMLFDKKQFMYIETEASRNLTGVELLERTAAHTGMYFPVGEELSKPHFHWNFAVFFLFIRLSRPSLAGRVLSTSTSGNAAGRKNRSSLALLRQNWRWPPGQLGRGGGGAGPSWKLMRRRRRRFFRRKSTSSSPASPRSTPR